MPNTIDVLDANSTTQTVSTVDALLQRVGEVASSPTANTVLDRLKSLATLITVLSEWDESDRAKVNIISGQAGVAAGAGAVGATTQRMTLGSDDPAVAALGSTGDAAATAGSTGSVSAKLRTMTAQLATLAGYLDGVETLLGGTMSVALDAASLAALETVQVNPISGQTGVAAGAGAVGTTTQRVTLASDDPAVSGIGGTSDAAATAGSMGSVSAKLRLMTTQLNTLSTYLDGVETALAAIASETTLAALNTKVANGHGTAATAVRVELPTDGTGVVGLNAGTNTIGGVMPVAATSGGATPSHLISAGTTNATSLKASAGQVYGVQLTNKSTTAAAYVKFYNKASAPTVGTDTPVKVFTLPAAADATQPTVLVHSMPLGVAFGTGIAFAVTGGSANSDTTAVAAGDVIVDIDYK